MKQQEQQAPTLWQHAWQLHMWQGAQHCYFFNHSVAVRDACCRARLSVMRFVVGVLQLLEACVKNCVPFFFQQLIYSDLWQEVMRAGEPMRNVSGRVQISGSCSDHHGAGCWTQARWGGGQGSLVCALQRQMPL